MANSQKNRRSFFKKAGALLASFGIGAASTDVADAAPRKASKKVVGTVVKDDDDVPLFSSHTIHNDLVFIAGKGAHFDGDIKEHTDHVLNELEKELEEAGSSMEQVLKATVYLHNLDDYDAMNEVFRGRFGENPPARSTVAVYGGVPGDSLVEIDCVAYI